MDIIDFTNAEIVPTYLYRGANGKKIGIIYNKEIYMLKFPSTAKNNAISYSNSTISEYISCKIFETLGFDTQQTILGIYRLSTGEEKIVCACKDFTVNNLTLKEFAELKNSIIEGSSQNGYETDLDEVLNTIEEQKLIENKILRDYFWDMFIADSLLGNFDRHNGNWGFLINRDSNSVSIAPIFDCGSCLFPQLSDKDMEDFLKDKAEIEKRTYIFPNSALKIDNKKINYYECISSLKDKDCNEALLRMFPKIDMNKINNVIDNTPLISNVRKEFYKEILQNRYEKILKESYKKLLELSNE